MILDETFELIKKKQDISQLGIKDFRLGNPYNMILLNNGAVGAAMNYHELSSEQVKRLSLFIRKKLETQPLLEKFLFSGKSLIKSSLKCCLLNALSKDLFSEYKMTADIEKNIFRNVKSAAVFGFGGLLNHLLEETEIPEINISDLQFSKFDFMKKRLDDLRLKYPSRKITISEGGKNNELVKNSDLLCITASAFCNSTMESLLSNARNQKVIVQGFSCAFYPEALFVRGVDLLSTAFLPLYVWEKGKDNSKLLNYYLEDGIPSTYVYPK